MGVPVADILFLARAAQPEAVSLDRDCLDKLYERLGFHDADHLVCRAVEDLSQRLAEAGSVWRDADWGNLLETAQRVDQIATQVGLPALARCARDVAECIQTGDRPALDATLWRLVRIGETTLNAVWGQQDLSL